MDKDLIVIDDEKVALIKRTVAVGATDDELNLFLHQARRMGLDPLARQIHFQKYKSKDGKENVSFITTIDGYRLIADRTGKYAGSAEPVFDGRIIDTQYGATDKGPDIPAKATVTVHKIVGGMLREFSHSAYWKEYYPGEWKGHMWRKMPHVMLAKVAEAGALRKAFPADLSGVYTNDEMSQSDIPAIHDDDIIDMPVIVERTPVPDTYSAADANHDLGLPANGNGKPQLPANLRRKLHAVGTDCYGDEWDDKRAAMSAAFHVKSSNDWTVEQAEKVIAGMQKIISERVAEQEPLFDDLTGAYQE